MIAPLPGQTPLPLDHTGRPPTHPVEPIVREALVEGAYRYWLRRAWGSGPSVAWVGMNPSTADDRHDDPTMLAEIGFSFRLGYGSLCKLNIFPFRSPNPKALDDWFGGPEVVEAMARNMKFAADEVVKCDTLIAAWGEGPEREWVEIFLTEVGKGRDWYCLALTASGAPRHTLARGRHFIPRDAKPVIWRAAS